MTHELPLVSVVVPMYNASATIGAQLEALASQDYEGPLEVLVADNGSTDDSVTVAARHADRLAQLSVLDASQRKGAGVARNAGIAAATGALVLFCDADDVVAPDWVSAMADALDRCDVVGGRLEVESLNDELSRAWRTAPSQHDLPRLLDYLPYAMGSNMGARAEVLAEVGGFDESYDRGGEETDLCWRAQLALRTLDFEPQAVVHYRLRTDLAGLVRQNRTWGLSSVDLYRAYRSLGAPPGSVPAALAVWARLLLVAPLRLARRRDRGVWLGRVAYRWGRVLGSIEHRVVYL